MKRFLSLAGLALLVGLAAFTGPITNNGRITFATSAGEQTYSSTNVPMSLDASTGAVMFFFKPAAFSSGDKNKDGQLNRLTQSDAYGTIEFSGSLEKSAATLKNGGKLVTAAVGTLTFAGKKRSARVPMTVFKQNGKYGYTISAVVDCSVDPASRTIANEIGVQGPLRINLSRTL